MCSLSDSNNSSDKNPNDSGNMNISHSPLNLGGGDASAAPKPAQQAVPAERITAVKTFFAKLNIGAIEFLDEQIAKWLSENPNIQIKQTNVVAGEIQGKKTEPNIIITVWY